MTISPAVPPSFLQGQNAVLEMIATGQPIGDTLDTLIRLLESQGSAFVCGIAVADELGARFTQSFGPELPLQYLQATSSFSLHPPFQGSCGEATHLGVAVRVDDLEHDDRYSEGWKALLRSAGFTSVQSEPIPHPDRTTLGSLAFYGRTDEARFPNREAIDIAVHLATLALERERTQSRLLSIEQRWQSAIEAVHGVMWTNNAAGEMVGEQAAWGKLTGQSPREYQGFGWSSAIHPEDAQPTIAAWRAAVAARQPFVFEHRVRRADGEWRRCTVRAIPTVSVAGEIVEWVGVHTDITDRSILELEHAHLAAMVQQSSDFVLFADSSGGASYLNDVGSTMVHLQPSDAAKKTLTDYFCEASRVVIAVNVLPTLAERGRWHGELALRIFDSDLTIPSACNIFHVRNAQGRVVGLGLVARDLSQQKLNESALTASEATFKAVFETVPVGIVIAEAPSGRIIAGNAQLDAIVGHSLIKSQDVAEYARWVSHHPDGSVVKAHEYPLARVLNGESAAQLEALYVRGDGETTWVRFIAAPIRSSGKITGAIVASLDIDREKRALQALETAREELELRVIEEVQAREAAQASLAQAQRMEALGRLAGGIAHDINNVLQSISGGLSLIRKRSGNPEDVVRTSKMASEAVKRGASITARLLSFARSSELRAVAIEPSQLLHNLQELLASTIGTTIRVLVDVAATGRFFADKAQLETVLINLAVNARDAMPEGGTLTLRAIPEDRPIGMVVEELNEEGYVRLEVSDTGTGMDEATLAQAAQPFFTTKEPGKGTGLGLAMARGFALQSNGAFQIQSVYGAGTTVTIWLPRSLTTEDENEGASPTEPRLARQGTAARSVILLVDDDLMVRQTIAETLQDDDCTVLQAADGLGALDVISQGATVDLLVTDFSMPGMNGSNLLREVRARLPELPVVILTGYADEREGLSEVMRSESVLLLRKPVAPEELLRAVGQMLGTKSTTAG